MPSKFPKDTSFLEKTVDYEKSSTKKIYSKNTGDAMT